MLKNVNAQLRQIEAKERVLKLMRDVAGVGGSSAESGG